MSERTERLKELSETYENVKKDFLASAGGVLLKTILRKHGMPYKRYNYIAKKDPNRIKVQHLYNENGLRVREKEYQDNMVKIELVNMQKKVEAIQLEIEKFSDYLDHIRSIKGCNYLQSQAQLQTIANHFVFQLKTQLDHSVLAGSIDGFNPQKMKNRT